MERASLETTMLQILPFATWAVNSHAVQTPIGVEMLNMTVTVILARTIESLVVSRSSLRHYSYSSTLLQIELAALWNPVVYILP